jgi:outer membrane protein assembly factor BamB
VNLYALSDNTVVALNPADGSLRWQHSLTRVGDLPIDTFQAVHNTIFIQANDTLTALDSSDGKERWHISDYGFVSAANGIALASIGHTLSGLRVNDGKRLWSFPTDQGIFSARIVGDVVYVIYDLPPDSTLHALDIRDGKERWHFQPADPVDVQAVTQGSVYVTLEPPGGAGNS